MKSNIVDLFSKDGSFQVAGSIWVEKEGGRCFGPGKLELLQGIEKTGSINQAAREMGMSYKKAWRMVQELNTHFSTIIVLTKGGGEGGGGSALTPAAQRLMQHYQEMQDRLKAFFQEEQQLFTTKKI